MAKKFEDISFVYEPKVIVIFFNLLLKNTGNLMNHINVCVYMLVLFVCFILTVGCFFFFYLFWKCVLKMLSIIWLCLFVKRDKKKKKTLGFILSVMLRWFSYLFTHSLMQIYFIFTLVRLKFELITYITQIPPLGWP